MNIKISLNGKCPCWSGEKYKKCCIGKLTQEQEKYFSFLQYSDKIKNKLIMWFWTDLNDFERDYYAKEFGVKNIKIIESKDNPAEFFEWLFYQAREKETKDSILKFIIERYPFLFDPNELLLLRERLNNNQVGVFELLKSDEKTWKIVLKEIISGETCEVLDRLGSSHSAIGDIIITRIEKIFSKYYICGYGINLQRRNRDEFLKFINRFYEDEKKKNAALTYKDFMNNNAKAIMKFESEPMKIVASTGENLVLCEGKYKIDVKEIPKLMNFFEKNTDFIITEHKINSQKNYAHIILKKNEDESAKQDNKLRVYSFMINPSGQKIEYIAAIKIKKDNIKIFSQSKDVYRNLIERINNLLNKKLVVLKESIEEAEKILRRIKTKPKQAPKHKEYKKYRNDELEKGFLKDYYKNWCNEKIPALNNQTPREAIKTEDGKKLLKELLLDMKNMDEHKRKSGETNFSTEQFIRNELCFYD